MRLERLAHLRLLARERSHVGRVLDDGSSQVSTYTYNTRGQRTQAIDPLGRETDYLYDATGLDLVQVTQKRGGTFDILEARTYNAQHEPLTITDAARPSRARRAANTAPQKPLCGEPSRLPRSMQPIVPSFANWFPCSPSWSSR